MSNHADRKSFPLFSTVRVRSDYVTENEIIPGACNVIIDVAGAFGAVLEVYGGGEVYEIDFGDFSLTIAADDLDGGPYYSVSLPRGLTHCLYALDDGLTHSSCDMLVEYDDWLAENTSWHQTQIVGFDPRHLQGLIYFRDELEATLFKLRWC